ncbi:hypothetical protein CSOJ01_14524 [Colletotrichum sojae]|uniref:Uncharacterized protein n=1 Tax=Colletotrichum sojae TaxID=2175907 RepID=A0A8H6IPK5_9PEZI|nr:hypothetical protein CSOJ01_14524 [Colletotrichum sojae]
MSPVGAPVFQDHLMAHDLPIPTTEHASTPPRPQVHDGNNVGTAVKNERPEFKEESADVMLSPVSEATPPARKERIYFFKRIADGIPHIDVLFQVGEGELLPGTPQYDIENGLWEATDGLFVFRQTGPRFKVLQSAVSAMFEEKGASRAVVREHMALKTAAFVGNRDAHGEFHILKFTMSGNVFQTPTGKYKDMVMHHGKWRNRVKKLALILGLKMRTFYDGGGRKATPEDYGNWAAGHCEKKLSTFVEDLDLLKNTLMEHGLRPRFEIHLTRAPCGSARKPGCCIQFAHRLGYATGVDFEIHSWEDNVILDGTVPPRPPAKGANLEIVAEIERQRAMNIDENEDQDEEEDAADFDFYLASQYEDNWRGIVFDGFDPAQDEPAPDPRRQPSPASTISPEARENFAKTIQRKFGRKEKRLPDDIIKPYPPTPVTEAEWSQIYDRSASASQPPAATRTSNHFGDGDADLEAADREESPPAMVQQRRAANAQKAETRRKKKLEKRARKAAAAAAAGRDVELEVVGL